MRLLPVSAVLLLVTTPALAQEAPPPAPAEPAPAQPELPHVALESDAPPVLTLTNAIALALARNPTAITAYAEIERARALVAETRANALPTLFAYGTLTQLDAPRTIAGIVSLPQTGFQANAALTVPLIVPKPWAQWSQSKDQVDVAKSSAEDTRRVVAVAVARAYLTVVAQKRVIDAAVRARDTDAAHYDYANKRFVGGVGNRIDEVRAHQQLQSDEANVQQQYANLARDREALGVLVGVGGAIDAEETPLSTPASPQEALAEAERRSDVRAANARMKQAQHTVHDDWTDYSPYLVGSFVPFYQTPATVTYPTTGWQAQLILTIPLYDGGLRYGQEHERAANRDEAKAQLDGVLRQARSDVRTAFEELKRADAALASSREAAKLAESALELANIAYRAGAYTNIEVIDAERTARDAETAVAVAEDGARQARLDMLAATGRLP
ncbi:MAG TPA: TolC family protein [Polyangiaceae bacterium]